MSGVFQCSDGGYQDLELGPGCTSDGSWDTVCTLGWRGAAQVGRCASCETSDTSVSSEFSESLSESSSSSTRYDVSADSSSCEEFVIVVEGQRTEEDESSLSVTTCLLDDLVADLFNAAELNKMWPPIQPRRLWVHEAVSSSGRKSQSHVCLLESLIQDGMNDISAETKPSVAHENLLHGLLYEIGTNDVLPTFMLPVNMQSGAAEYFGCGVSEELDRHQYLLDGLLDEICCDTFSSAIKYERLLQTLLHETDVEVPASEKTSPMSSVTKDAHYIGLMEGLLSASVYEEDESCIEDICSLDQMISELPFGKLLNRIWPSLVPLMTVGQFIPEDFDHSLTPIPMPPSLNDTLIVTEEEFKRTNISYEFDVEAFSKEALVKIADSLDIFYINFIDLQPHINPISGKAENHAVDFAISWFAVDAIISLKLMDANDTDAHAVFDVGPGHKIGFSVSVLWWKVIDEEEEPVIEDRFQVVPDVDEQEKLQQHLSLLDDLISVLGPSHH